MIENLNNWGGFINFVGKSVIAMIESVKGEIAELNPTYCVIETAGGVGYNVNITLPTYTALQGQTSVRLLVHEIIREDAWTLFGFIAESERQIFRSLIGVSGVGANTARVILSSIPSGEIEQTILSGDVRRLKAVKGIGAKTAERIIVDLKDKIKPIDTTLIIQPTVNSESYEEALSALVMLGFPRPASQKALKKVFEEDPDIKVEAAIKQAFKLM